MLEVIRFLISEWIKSAESGQERMQFRAQVLYCTYPHATHTIQAREITQRLNEYCVTLQAVVVPNLTGRAQQLAMSFKQLLSRPILQ